MFIKNEKRKQILESFDYVTLQQTQEENDEEYVISIDEQIEIIEGLIKLYEKIDEFNSIL